RFQATDATALTLFGDRVRGTLRGQGGDLPRIPADRFGARLEHDFSSALDGQLELYRVQRQGRVADYDTETAGYNMLGAGLSYHGSLSQSDCAYTVFLKGDNLLDEKARNNISFIKDDVLLPGRNFTVGLRVSF
ncbi:MAG TPA: TonB-dependent receptor, partial [Pseudomonas sp.]|nr:TonB-dependent receptor [Pseudomonas sp.]